MKKLNFIAYLPHLLAIGIFLLVSVIFCLPLFQGLVVSQHDMIGTKGMTQQSIEFYEKYGHYPLWTNSMFSGMPTFQILFAGKYNIGIGWLHNVFTAFLPSPAGLFFLSCICFYILSQVLKLKNWVGILGSLGYAFASYNAVIAVVGHVTKFATMGYAPAVIAGFILLMKRKYILGFATTLIFSTLFFTQNHVQMVYYFMFIIIFLGISFLVKTILENDFKHLFITAALGISAVAISACSFAVILLPTNDYAKETMRGGRSELTLDQKKGNKSEGGLNKDYAFGWSYGKAETFTFILPSFKGGSTNPDELAEDSHVAQALQDAGLREDGVNYYKQFFRAYWGDQPGTSGPVYFGAIICLLVIASLFVVPPKYLSWLIPSTILGIVLAWGSNLSSVNYFLFDHLPGLNKFRSPSSAMVVPQLTFAIMASLAAQHLFYSRIGLPELMKRLKYAAFTFAGILVILAGIYFTSSFSNPKDNQTKESLTSQFAQMMSQGKQPTNEIMAQASSTISAASKALVKDRQSMFGQDLLWLCFFAMAGGLLVWLSVNKKLKPSLAVGLLALLSFINLVMVDSRYLNKSHYKTSEDYMSDLNPTNGDLQIKKDTGYFRVFDQSTGGDPFQDSRASYFHNSVGGYSPAKLALYEDLKIHQLEKGNMEVYNMLNAKYFIAADPSDQTGKRTIAQMNPNANGPCWFVKAVKYVSTANEEMLALDSLHSKDTVVIDKREQSKVTAAPQFDSTATITLVNNKNDEINYQSKAAATQFAVFSEIYYPRGWKAFIDGKESPIIKVDYAFRGLVVPAGDHSIKFVFDPPAFKTGDTVSMIGGVITLLALLVCAVLLFRQFNKNDHLPEKS